MPDQRRERTPTASVAPVERLVSRDLYRLLVESVRDYGIFHLDRNGYVASWNIGAERIKGYSAEDIIGKHFSIFYPPEKIAEGFPQRELEVAAIDGRFEDEGWRIRKDGTRFWASVVITALFGEGGDLVGYAKVTRDLTERRLAEERAIADAQRLASVEAANRAKSEFLAAMSHELRTPLNAIGGYAELLSLGVRGPVNEEMQHDLDRIRRSQQHLLAIVNDLLNYSRIEAGRLDYQIERVHLDAAMRASLTLIEQQARSRDITLSHEDAGMLAALADRARLEQILLNLLSNALKFTPRGGRITLRADAVDDHVEVRVTDTGIGIPPEKQASIFEPFVQLGRSLTSVTEGAGLGLAISRDLARGMKGDLRVESEPGAGSAFILSLPRPEEAA